MKKINEEFKNKGLITEEEMERLDRLENEAWVEKAERAGELTKEDLGLE